MRYNLSIEKSTNGCWLRLRKKNAFDLNKVIIAIIFTGFCASLFTVLDPINVISNTEMVLSFIVPGTYVLIHCYIIYDVVYNCVIIGIENDDFELHPNKLTGKYLSDHVVTFTSPKVND